MLEKLKDMPQGIEGLKAVGRLSKQDYVEVFEPLIDAAQRDGRRLRFLYEFGSDFAGFTAGAAWEDAKLGLRSMRLFDACAIVSDVGWLQETARLFAFMMPCPVKVFGRNERHKAIEWLASLPAQETVTTHRLLPGSGVIVMEVTQALSTQDFDALALTADTWIEAHGNLQGLVIHTRDVPGWENLGSMLRHLRFVRDHHRKVKRVALVSDSKLASVAPHVGEHFVKAEVKAFGYDDLEPAIAWAGAM